MRPWHGNESRARRRLLVTTDRLGSQSGASLILALCMVLVLAVTLSSVLAYTRVIYKTTPIYTKQRVQRYAGDGAIETAINHVRNNLNQGMDPNYDDSQTCAYNVPTAAGTVAVTCQGDAGSGSGVPVDGGGLYPDSAILALGTNHEESGPYNYSGCRYLGADIDNATAETSVNFRRGQVTTWDEQGNLVSACERRNRSMDQFAVRGSVAAAGKLSGEGSLAISDAKDDLGNVVSAGKAYIGYGACNTLGITVTSATAPACVKLAPSDTKLADPGNGGSVEAWNPVPINWNNDHVRTGGFKWDGTSLTPASGCSSGDTIVLLPGTYSQASYLNQYTANSGCKQLTLWLAPDPGADGLLLTDDDKTGAYYFNFDGGAAVGCSNLPNNTHRWCIGAQSDANIRVVTGTPKGWNPLSVGTGASADFTLNTAGIVDGNTSTAWSNTGRAKTIDGQTASYGPICLFGLICTPSDDRSIILRGFLAGDSKATSIPVLNSDGKRPITITVAHREIGSGLNPPQINIRTTGGVPCPDTYTIPSNNSSTTLKTDALLLGGSATAAANSVGACLSSVDRINDMEITMREYGNSSNSGSPRPGVFLDGMNITYKANPTATFPSPPANSTDTSASPDCDKSKPGAQLIFAGESNAYVADGSLEACAGPYPTNPGRHQQVAIYGVKALAPLRPTTVVPGGNNANFNGDTSGTAAKQIAEPDRATRPLNQTVMTINYGTTDNSGCWVCAKPYEGRAVATMAGYTPPAGQLQLNKITARVTYNSHNTCIKILLWSLGCLGTNSQLRAGSCGSVDAPKTDTLRSWQTDVTNCFTAADIASGATVTWAARASQYCLSPRINLGILGTIPAVCFNNSASDQLDGIELVVSDKAVAGGTTPVPQSGCVTAYPNYDGGKGDPSYNSSAPQIDCAVIRSDSLLPTSWLNNLIPGSPQWLQQILNAENGANWFGRFSVEGTIYAPSSAIEIDDQDSAYPLASRGLVVRHLRVKGFRQRTGATVLPVDLNHTDLRKDREVTFIACIRGPGRSAVTTACSKSAGDQILTKARVGFTYVRATPAVGSTPGTAATSYPKVRWWNAAR